MANSLIQNYLRFWTKRYLKRVNPKIIAITGSVGKTSAKEAIFLVLSEAFPDVVRKSPGNLNTETGVPLTILGFDKSPTKPTEWLPIIILAPFRSISEKPYQYLVLEMAADKPGDIKYLTDFVKPDISVLTAIGPSHLEAFGSIDRIAEEKTNILRALESNGWAVLNIDNELVRKSSYGGRWQKVTYGIKEAADIKAEQISTEIINYQPKTSFKVGGKFSATVNSSTLGQNANVYAMLAAAAVGYIFKIKTDTITKALDKFQMEKHAILL